MIAKSHSTQSSRRAVIHSIDKKSLFAARYYFISLDNAYRAVREASKSKQEPKQDKTKKSGRYGFSAPRAPTIAITGDTTVVKPKAKAACYVCGSTDHLANYHTTDGKAKVPPAQALIKVNEDINDRG